MQLRRVRVDDPEIDRFVEECWFPYHEAIGDAVADHSLIEAVDHEAVVDHLRDVLDAPSARLWVALDDVDDSTTSLATTDARFAGFVRTSLDPTPPGFEWPPDRIRIHDLWVADPYRGSGLADELVARVRRQALENGCERLVLTVECDNDRAITYFETLGFEIRGLGMDVPLDDVELTSRRAEGASGEKPTLPLRRIRVEEPAVHRFVEDAWMPFWEAIGAADDRPRLGPDLEPEDVVGVFLEELDTPDKRVWVALDDPPAPGVGVAAAEAGVAGWLAGGLADTDRFLDFPDRLEIARLYVAPEYRGEGLADRLMDRALQYAREEGCVEFSLDVGVDNERAVAYYENLGFKPSEQRMSVGVDELGL